MADIGIIGLRFFDNRKDIPWMKKSGAPFVRFGLQRSNRLYPLPFQYLATDAVTSFIAVEIDVSGRILSETELNISAITADGTYHKSSGVGLDVNMKCGINYFVVNGVYVSDIFDARFSTPEGISLDVINDTLIVYAG